MDMWNERELHPPPASSCKLRDREINLTEVHTLFKETTSLFSKGFTSKMVLDLECNILMWVIRRNKTRLRTSMRLKFLQKLSKCMRNYKNMRYGKLLNDFMSRLPYKYESDITYFPSRNLLDYVLVRTQGLARLFARALHLAKEAFIHCQDQLLIGHNVGISIVMMALVSRIFVILRYLLTNLFTFYDLLVPLRDKIPNVQFEWMPGDYELPAKLKPWTDVDWVFTERQTVPAGHLASLFNVNLFENDDVEFCNEYQIVDGDNDLEIVNEYLQIVDSDGEQPIDAVNDEINVIHKRVRSLLGPERSSQVNAFEDIGAPICVDAKATEVSDKLSILKNLTAAANFVTEYRLNYFPDDKSYTELLQFIEVSKQNLSEHATRKKKKKALKDVKDKIVEVVRNQQVETIDE